MATSEEGELHIVAVTAAQNNKTASFNGHETILTKANAGLLLWDGTGLSGTRILTEAYTQNGFLELSGALGGAVTLELSEFLQKGFWIHDVSTGYSVTIQPTGGAGSVVPKNRWVFYYAATGLFTKAVAGWQDPSEAPALSFAAAYQVVSGRELKLYKEGESAAVAGGRVTLEGAVEETTTPPAEGNTIVTLPANYRPAHSIGAVAIIDPATNGLAVTAQVEITTAGAVILRNIDLWATPAIDIPIDLSGISFFVGN